MEPASLTLGCIALLSPLLKCGKEIRKAVKRIRSSRRDILDLADDTIIFTGLCEDFLREACAHDGGAYADRSLPIEFLSDWITRTSRGLEEILQKVQALKSNPTARLSLEQKLIAYLEWLFSKSLVEYLRKNMSVLRESINGFSNLMCIQKLNEELRWLKTALADPMHCKEVEAKWGMSIDAKIKLVQSAV